MSWLGMHDIISGCGRRSRGSGRGRPWSNWPLRRGPPPPLWWRALHGSRRRRRRPRRRGARSWRSGGGGATSVGRRWTRRRRRWRRKLQRLRRLWRSCGSAAPSSMRRWWKKSPTSGEPRRIATGPHTDALCLLQSSFRGISGRTAAPNLIDRDMHASGAKAAQQGWRGCAAQVAATTVYSFSGGDSSESAPAAQAAAGRGRGGGGSCSSSPG